MLKAKAAPSGVLGRVGAERNRTPRTRQTRSQNQFSVLGAMLRFAISGLVAVAVIGLIVLYIARTTANHEAIADAKQLTGSMAVAVVEPSLTDGLLSGDPAALAAFDRVIHERVLGNPTVRVKLWTSQGTILYSDEPRLIGRNFTLEEDELSAFTTMETQASISDLSAPENQFEDRGRELLEVYRPVRTPNGTVLLFEAYQPFQSVQASGQETWIRFLPALIAGLLAVELVHLPLAWSLARKLRRR